MEGAMPAAASHRKRHTSRRTHTSRAAIRDADSDRARPSPLDRIHTPEGITLQHREMGPIQLTNHFITESGELRLLIMVPEDSSGSVGVKVSNTTHRVERLTADGTAAAGGLLRIGDRVISVDGTLLGETKLLDAINVSVREHALIVHRAATDLRAVNGLKQLPEAALAGCHLAQLLRANLGSTRLAGKRTQLGLSVNKNNGIDYVVPGSVAAFEGTLRYQYASPRPRLSPSPSPNASPTTLALTRAPTLAPALALIRRTERATSCSSSTAGRSTLRGWSNPNPNPSPSPNPNPNPNPRRAVRGDGHQHRVG